MFKLFGQSDSVREDQGSSDITTAGVPSPLPGEGPAGDFGANTPLVATASSSFIPGLSASPSQATALPIDNITDTTSVISNNDKMIEENSKTASDHAAKIDGILEQVRGLLDSIESLKAQLGNTSSPDSSTSQAFGNHINVDTVMAPPSPLVHSDSSTTTVA